MSSRQTNTRTNRQKHHTFIKGISDNMLNELLHRASDGILQKDIQKVIQPDIRVRVKLDTIYNRVQNKISLYIFFVKNGQELGHISFHMFPNDNSVRGDVGIFHIQNTSNGKRPLLVEELGNRIFLSIGNSGGSGITLIMKECGMKAIGVLNRYLNPDNDEESLSLRHDISKKRMIPHTYFSIILRSFSEKKITPANTRKFRKNQRFSSTPSNKISKAQPCTRNSRNVSKLPTTQSSSPLNENNRSVSRRKD